MGAAEWARPCPPDAISGEVDGERDEGKVSRISFVALRVKALRSGLPGEEVFSGDDGGLV